MAAQVIHPQLQESIFRVPIRPSLLHQVVMMQLSGRRTGTASTKTRGMVRGSGRKPWRQKGTGRARAGSVRSPIWVGGGTVFGPHPRDYSYRMPKKARKEALLTALSLKLQEEKIIVVDKIELAEMKTKEMKKTLADLGVESALIVIPAPDERIERSARNLATVKVLRAQGLNVYDILCYKHLILTEQSLKAIEERLAPAQTGAEVSG
ncbi:MAG: 50S ribosomal protein L4 [Deltaproteobacteria bacterium]|nr:50S ribosomal protein L4 [Deltaproteobacteria bacterium]